MPMTVTTSNQANLGLTGKPAFHYYSVDILRALACLWVFTVHLPLPHRLLEDWPWLRPLMGQAELSFMTFYIISGLVIYLTLTVARQKSESAGQFIRKRLTRTMPTYWASLPVVMAVPFVVELISALKSGQIHWPWPDYLNYSWIEWIRVVTLTQIFFAPGTELASSAFQAINTPVWALAIVIQFYLLVAIAYRISRRYWRWSLVLLALSSIPTLTMEHREHSGWIFPYGLAFALGAALGALIFHGGSPRRLLGKSTTLVTLPAAIACITAILAMVTGELIPDPYLAQIYSILLTLLLWLIHPFDGLVKRFRDTQSFLLKPFSWMIFTIGAMSFTIYLLHGKMYWVGMLFARQISAEGTGKFMLLTMVITIVLCYPFYRWVEKPLTGYRRVKPAPSTPPVNLQTTSAAALPTTQTSVGTPPLPD